MKAPSSRILLMLLALVLARPSAAALDFDFRAPASATDPSVPAVMRDLAGRILPVYQENDPERYLSNLSALQMVAGDYGSAYSTRQSLLERRRSTKGGRPVGRALVYDIYVRARAIETQVRVPFAKAYSQAFRDAANRIDDLDAYTLESWLTTPLPVLQEGLQRAFDQRRGKASLSLPEAIDVIWAYFALEAYRSFGPLVSSLAADEDQRRYLTDETLQIKTPDGATLAAVLVRPRISSKRLPTLMELTLEEDARSARESAAHGYVGLVAYVRGTRGEPDGVVPFEHEGDDARTVIEWIAKQPWSDGRVGMYGDRYSGFAAWAAAKRMPAALKAIATSDPSAPGVDVPMAGSIFRNSAYRWVYELTSTSDETAANDDARWRALDEEWYKRGQRYREYPRLPGPASVLFRSWLNHPSYDRYWQKYVPFREEFAHINIPVLTMSGYYADGEIGALYYFNEHHRHDPRANHTLLMGPYDDGAVHRVPASVLRGYEVDPVAVVDLRELRYDWFDYALRRGKKPALLAERVNYQVMEANEWRHAPSLAALAKAPLRLFLEPTPGEAFNALATAKSDTVAFLPQRFDLADRSDVGWRPSAFIVSRSLKPPNGELYVSEPFKQPLEIGGLLSGSLELTVNKMDIDLSLALYELRPDGEYIKLFDPADAFRASYAHDRVARHLLRAGQRQLLPFKSERMMSRKLQAGSRLVLVLGINKRADQQVNYGTGDDVSEESIEDADVPLRIRWYNSSYIDVPIRR
jgi:uncharacterized protein